MPSQPDSPYDALVQGFRDAKAIMKESARAVKADIVSPADPNAKRATKTERMADIQDLLNNPARLESEFLRLKDRYKLPEEKPIPRRLVEYLKQGLKEQQAEEPY